MSRYRKIEVKTWMDEKFRGLSAMLPSGQGLWLFLMTGPHTGPIPGLFRAGRAGMAEELGWELEAFDEAFEEVSALGMAKADFKSRLVWLPNALKHNKPESPNVVRSWRVEMDLLPECDLKREAVGQIREHLKAVGSAYAEAFEEVAKEPAEKPLKASPKPSPKAMPNQEQEQEQEQEKPTASSPARLPTCPYDAIVATYREVLPELPSVRVMDDERKRGIRKRWEWVLTTCKPDGSRRATTPDEAQSWFRSYFELARDNDFLMGRTKRSGEHANWKCDIDFLMTTRGLKQVLERTEAA